MHESERGESRSREPPNPDGRSERVSEQQRTRVLRAAIEALSPKERTRSNLYMDRWIVPEGTLLGLSFAGWRVEHNSILCFADHEPRANFAHACSYYLHDLATGELLRRVPARFPPYPNRGLHFLELFHEPIRRPQIVARRAPMTTRLKTHTQQITLPAHAPTANRYAILFAGMAEAWHLNDLELYRRTLILEFGFAPENVYTLFNDGTATSTSYFDEVGNIRPYPGPVAPPPSPGAPDPHNLYSTQFPKPWGKGSRTAFLAALSDISQKKLHGNDLLFILTEGHGELLFLQNPTVEQCLVAIPEGQTSDLYRSSEMQADLQTLGPAYDALLVVMNQCYSGGFREAILAGSTAQRTFFAHASGADQLAYTDELYQWNEFSRHWMEAAMRQCLDPSDVMPNMDDDKDGKIDASEALMFCKIVNRFDHPDSASASSATYVGGSPSPEDIALA
jgi:hypothetical protein